MSVKSPKCSQESAKAVQGFNTSSQWWEGLVKRSVLSLQWKIERSYTDGRGDDDKHELAWVKWNETNVKDYYKTDEMKQEADSKDGVMQTELGD